MDAPAGAWASSGRGRAKPSLRLVVQGIRVDLLQSPGHFPEALKELLPVQMRSGRVMTRASGGSFLSLLARAGAAGASLPSWQHHIVTLAGLEVDLGAPRPAAQGPESSRLDPEAFDAVVPRHWMAWHLSLTDTRVIRREAVDAGEALRLVRKVAPAEGGGAGELRNGSFGAGLDLSSGSSSGNSSGSSSHGPGASHAECSETNADARAATGWQARAARLRERRRAIDTTYIVVRGCAITEHWTSAPPGRPGVAPAGFTDISVSQAWVRPSPLLVGEFATATVEFARGIQAVLLVTALPPRLPLPPMVGGLSNRDAMRFIVGSTAALVAGRSANGPMTNRLVAHDARVAFTTSMRVPAQRRSGHRGRAGPGSSRSCGSSGALTGAGRHSPQQGWAMPLSQAAGPSPRLPGRLCGRIASQLVSLRLGFVTSDDLPGAWSFGDVSVDLHAAKRPVRVLVPFAAFQQLEAPAALADRAAADDAAPVALGAAHAGLHAGCRSLMGSAIRRGPRGERLTRAQADVARHAAGCAASAANLVASAFAPPSSRQIRALSRSYPSEDWYEPVWMAYARSLDRGDVQTLDDRLKAPLHDDASASERFRLLLDVLASLREASIQSEPQRQSSPPGRSRRRARDAHTASGDSSPSGVPCSPAELRPPGAASGAAPTELASPASSVSGRDKLADSSDTGLPSQRRRRAQRASASDRPSAAGGPRARAPGPGAGSSASSQTRPDRSAGGGTVARRHSPGSQPALPPSAAMVDLVVAGVQIEVPRELRAGAAAEAVIGSVMVAMSQVAAIARALPDPAPLRSFHSAMALEPSLRLRVALAGLDVSVLDDPLAGWLGRVAPLWRSMSEHRDLRHWAGDAFGKRHPSAAAGTRVASSRRSAVASASAAASGAGALHRGGEPAASRDWDWRTAASLSAEEVISRSYVRAARAAVDRGRGDCSRPLAASPGNAPIAGPGADRLLRISVGAFTLSTSLRPRFALGLRLQGLLRGSSDSASMLVGEVEAGSLSLRGLCVHLQHFPEPLVSLDGMDLSAVGGSILLRVAGLDRARQLGMAALSAVDSAPNAVYVESTGLAGKGGGVRAVGVWLPEVSSGAHLRSVAVDVDRVVATITAHHVPAITDLALWASRCVPPSLAAKLSKATSGGGSVHARGSQSSAGMPASARGHPTMPPVRGRGGCSGPSSESGALGGQFKGPLAGLRSSSGPKQRDPDLTAASRSHDLAALSWDKDVQVPASALVLPDRVSLSLVSGILVRVVSDPCARAVDSDGLELSLGGVMAELDAASAKAAVFDVQAFAVTQARGRYLIATLPAVHAQVAVALRRVGATGRRQASYGLPSAGSTLSGMGSTGDGSADYFSGDDVGEFGNGSGAAGLEAGPRRGMDMVLVMRGAVQGRSGPPAWALPPLAALGRSPLADHPVLSVSADFIGWGHRLVAPFLSMAAVGHAYMSSTLKQADVQSPVRLRMVTLESVTVEDIEARVWQSSVEATGVRVMLQQASASVTFFARPAADLDPYQTGCMPLPNPDEHAMPGHEPAPRCSSASQGSFRLDGPGPRASGGLGGSGTGGGGGGGTGTHSSAPAWHVCNVEAGASGIEVRFVSAVPGNAGPAGRLVARVEEARFFTPRMEGMALTRLVLHSGGSPMGPQPGQMAAPHGSFDRTSLSAAAAGSEHQSLPTPEDARSQEPRALHSLVVRGVRVLVHAADGLPAVRMGQALLREISALLPTVQGFPWHIVDAANSGTSSASRAGQGSASPGQGSPSPGAGGTSARDDATTPGAAHRTSSSSPAASRPPPPMERLITTPAALPAVLTRWNQMLLVEVTDVQGQLMCGETSVAALAMLSRLQAGLAITSGADINQVKLHARGMSLALLTGLESSALRSQFASDGAWEDGDGDEGSQPADGSLAAAAAAAVAAADAAHEDGPASPDVGPERRNEIRRRIRDAAHVGTRGEASRALLVGEATGRVVRVGSRPVAGGFCDAANAGPMRSPAGGFGAQDSSALPPPHHRARGGQSSAGGADGSGALHTMSVARRSRARAPTAGDVAPEGLRARQRPSMAAIITSRRGTAAAGSLADSPFRSRRSSDTQDVVVFQRVLMPTDAHVAITTVNLERAPRAPDRLIPIMPPNSSPFEVKTLRVDLRVSNVLATVDPHAITAAVRLANAFQPLQGPVVAAFAPAVPPASSEQAAAVSARQLMRRYNEHRWAVQRLRGVASAFDRHTPASRGAAPSATFASGRAGSPGGKSLSVREALERGDVEPGSPKSPQSQWRNSAARWSPSAEESWLPSPSESSPAAVAQEADDAVLGHLVQALAQAEAAAASQRALLSAALDAALQSARQAPSATLSFAVQGIVAWMRDAQGAELVTAGIRSVAGRVQTFEADKVSLTLSARGVDVRDRRDGAPFSRVLQALPVGPDGRPLSSSTAAARPTHAATAPATMASPAAGAPAPSPAAGTEEPRAEGAREASLQALCGIRLSHSDAAAKHKLLGLVPPVQVAPSPAPSSATTASSIVLTPELERARRLVATVCVPDEPEMVVPCPVAFKDREVVIGKGPTPPALVHGDSGTSEGGPDPLGAASSGFAADPSPADSGPRGGGPRHVRLAEDAPPSRLGPSRSTGAGSDSGSQSSSGHQIGRRASGKRGGARDGQAGERRGQRQAAQHGRQHGAFATVQGVSKELAAAATGIDEAGGLVPSLLDTAAGASSGPGEPGSSSDSDQSDRSADTAPPGDGSPPGAGRVRRQSRTSPGLRIHSPHASSVSWEGGIRAAQASRRTLGGAAWGIGARASGRASPADFMGRDGVPLVRSPLITMVDAEPVSRAARVALAGAAAGEEHLPPPPAMDRPAAAAAVVRQLEAVHNTLLRMLPDPDEEEGPVLDVSSLTVARFGASRTGWLDNPRFAAAGAACLSPGRPLPLSFTALEAASPALRMALAPCRSALGPGLLDGRSEGGSTAMSTGRALTSRAAPTADDGFLLDSATGRASSRSSGLPRGSAHEAAGSRPDDDAAGFYRARQGSMGAASARPSGGPWDAASRTHLSSLAHAQAAAGSPRGQPPRPRLAHTRPESPSRHRAAGSGSGVHLSGMRSQLSSRRSAWTGPSAASEELPLVTVTFMTDVPDTAEKGASIIVIRHAEVSVLPLRVRLGMGLIDRLLTEVGEAVGAARAWPKGGPARQLATPPATPGGVACARDEAGAMLARLRAGLGMAKQLQVLRRTESSAALAHAMSRDETQPMPMPAVGSGSQSRAVLAMERAAAASSPWAVASPAAMRRYRQLAEPAANNPAVSQGHRHQGHRARQHGGTGPSSSAVSGITSLSRFSGASHDGDALLRLGGRRGGVDPAAVALHEDGGEVAARPALVHQGHLRDASLPPEGFAGSEASGGSSPDEVSPDYVIELANSGRFTPLGPSDSAGSRPSSVVAGRGADALQPGTVVQAFARRSVSSSSRSRQRSRQSGAADLVAEVLRTSQRDTSLQRQPPPVAPEDLALPGLGWQGFTAAQLLPPGEPTALPWLRRGGAAPVERCPERQALGRAATAGEVAALPGRPAGPPCWAGLAWFPAGSRWVGLVAATVNLAASSPLPHADGRAVFLADPGGWLPARFHGDSDTFQEPGGGQWGDAQFLRNKSWPEQVRCLPLAAARTGGLGSRAARRLAARGKPPGHLAGAAGVAQAAHQAATVPRPVSGPAPTLVLFRFLCVNEVMVRASVAPEGVVPMPRLSRAALKLHRREYRSLGPISPQEFLTRLRTDIVRDVLSQVGRNMGNIGSMLADLVTRRAARLAREEDEAMQREDEWQRSHMV
ncbi:hypothetical protein FNF29_05532 [Cafeteria roenbergensis]|uniref:Uncharacterized protein n=1 Tax=Cafeteria roenbergensis TaxID=33653 RepID=A0A5A8CAE9_CAFRO|nr:hypothetical protein FNF29_05532 [Cafeteria roenbergensis]|eukprot:KAA0150092.1 hypothetical protein FNF29_05532 [Cafeteria roenbergensis]